MSLSKLDEIKTRINAFRVGEFNRGNEWEDGPGEDFDWLIGEIESLKLENKQLKTNLALWEINGILDEEIDRIKSELQSAREVIEWYSDGLYPDDVSEIYKIQSMDGIEYQHKEHRVGRRARQWLEQHKQENRK